MDRQRQQRWETKIDTRRRDGDYTCLERGKHRPRTVVHEKNKHITATERKKNGESVTMSSQGLSVLYCVAEWGSRVGGGG